MELVQDRVLVRGSLFALLKNRNEHLLVRQFRKYVLWSVRSYSVIILSENSC